MSSSDFSNVPWICAKRWKEKASKVILESAVFFECLFKALRLFVDLLVFVDIEEFTLYLCKLRGSVGI